MNNCKQCKKQIESKTGRRPKVYCSPECRTTYGNAHKNKDRAMVKLKTYEKLLEENAALKDLAAELRKNNPVLDRGRQAESDMAIVKLKVDGKVSHNTWNITEIINQEPERQESNSAQDEISRLKSEIAAITSKTELSQRMRISLQKRIDRLEKLG